MNKPRGRARPLAELVGRCLADAFAKRGFASTEIVTHWEDIAGPEIAAHAEPMKIDWPRLREEAEPEPATLFLRVEGPAAIEIQHLSGVIIERVNRFFGWPAIGRIALRQAPLVRRRKRTRPPGPDPETVRRLAETLGVADEGLRDALARLGGAIERE